MIPVTPAMAEMVPWTRPSSFVPCEYHRSLTHLSMSQRLNCHTQKPARPAAAVYRPRRQARKEDVVLGLKVGDEVLGGLSREHRMPARPVAAVYRCVKAQQRLAPRPPISPYRPIFLPVDGFSLVEGQIFYINTWISALADAVFRFAAWVGSVKRIATFLPYYEAEGGVEVGHLRLLCRVLKPTMIAMAAAIHSTTGSDCAMNDTRTAPMVVAVPP